MRFIAISMVSGSGILVKRLVTSWETKTFLERFAFLIWETKEKVSLQKWSLGTKGERRWHRKRARISLKVPIDETIGQSLGNESLEENLCILGVPQIQAGAEPEGYNLSYSISWKKFFCFNLRKKRCSKVSCFKVASSRSFSNLEVSEIISSIGLL